MNPHSKEELFDSGYFALDKQEVWLIHENEPINVGNAKSIIGEVVNLKLLNSVRNLNVYRRCYEAFKMNKVNCYHHVSDFDFRDNEWIIPANKNERSAAIRKSFREKNMPILRMYNTGDPLQKFNCQITGQAIDCARLWGKEFNLWQQHHFLTLNRESVQKIGPDPYQILRSVDLTMPSVRSRLAIEDMMRTIFLSPSGHAMIHIAETSSDITNYENAQLPWALKNQTNWDLMNKYLQGFGHQAFPSYEEWMHDLKLANYQKN